MHAPPLSGCMPPHPFSAKLFFLPSAQRNTPTRASACVAGMEAALPFPLFDLPDAAVELVVSSVDCWEAKRALRLACRRSRDLVDRDVVSVCWNHEEGADDIHPSEVATLARAPWRPWRLALGCCGLRAVNAVVLADAHFWAFLQSLDFSHNEDFGATGAAVLAAADLRALTELFLCRSNLGDEGVALLAAAQWQSGLRKLVLSMNDLGPAAAAALAAGTGRCFRYQSGRRGRGGVAGNPTPV